MLLRDANPPKSPLMNTSRFRILFFTFFSCGFLGAAVFASLVLWPLWLRHQAVTRLVEAVLSSGSLDFLWFEDKELLKEFDEPLGRVKELRAEDWAARRLAKIVDDGECD